MAVCGGGGLFCGRFIGLMARETACRSLDTARDGARSFLFFLILSQRFHPNPFQARIHRPQQVVILERGRHRRVAVLPAKLAGQGGKKSFWPKIPT